MSGIGIHSVIVGFALALFAATSSAAVILEDDEYIIFHHQDVLGSTVVATGASGEMLWQEQSEPYGESLSRSRPNTDGDSGSGAAGSGMMASPDPFNEEEGQSRLGYTGHVRDGATGLTYMQARYYDPVLGRFLSNDPVGYTISNPMSFNRYAYANNNPYKYVDPDGRSVVTYLGGLIHESYEGITGRGDGIFNDDLPLNALANGYDGSGGLGGFGTALSEDVGLALDAATVGVAGAANRVAKTTVDAVVPTVEKAAAEITKASRKRLKRLIRRLSDNARREVGLSQEKTDQLRGMVERAGGTIRNDGTAGVRGSSAGQPHVQTEGLGTSTDSRHIWTQDGVE